MVGGPPQSGRPRRHGVAGAARLQPDRTVAIDTGDDVVVVMADVVLIATGSSPFRPPSIPFDDPDVFDSDTILDIDSIPDSLVVIGGGPVGCEYASIFAALGVEVTVIDGAPRLLGAMDREISQMVRASFVSMGMRVLLESPGAHIERRDGALVVETESGQVLPTEKVLFAAGRVGNTDGLGLEEAGVDLDERHRIVVDDHFRTTAPGIYAAGDVIGPPALASVSAEQGRIAACHAFQVPFDLTLDWLPPVCTIPEVAMVGMTESPRRPPESTTGGALLVRSQRSQPHRGVDRRDDCCVEPEDRRLLGVHVIGETLPSWCTSASGHACQGPIDRFLHDLQHPDPI